MRKPILKKYDPVLIRWCDACSHDPWQDVEELQKEAASAPTQRTIGFFIEQTEDHVLVARSFDNLDQVEGGFQVPSGMVVEIVRLYERKR